jgi:hypothetical protein
MNKGQIVMAFFLGLFSFVVFMFVFEESSYHSGNVVAAVITFPLMAAYFFICQSFLSRGHPKAYRRDWPIMLALDAVLILTVVISVFVEKREVVLTQSLGILVSCCGGTFAGALAASIKARRRADNNNSRPTPPASSAS